MKYIVILTGLLFLSIHQISAQKTPYNIVFDITTSDTATHARVIRWSKGILESHPDAKIEIVFYGRSLDMIVKNKSVVASDVIKLATEKKVSFVACEHAMKVFSIDKNQLLSGVTTVPDALYELVIRQAEGYGYIKVVN